MNDESIIINDRGLAGRLNRLHFIRKFYLTIGHAATRGQLILNRSIRADSDDSSSMRFIKSLQELATLPVSPKKKASDELDTVLARSNQVLVRATTVFPLTLFPDTVTLDRTKLTVLRRTFFFSEDTMSIRIEDILNVSTTLGPLFGAITIATRVMSTTDHFTIKNMWRDDAIRMSHMIQGYVIARHNNIACDHLSFDELVYTLKELGHESGRFSPKYLSPAKTAQKSPQ